MTSEWIWRETARGNVATCMRCGASVSGLKDAMERLERAHNPDVCVVMAQTPEARRARGRR
jgi:hypothetical protein